MVIGSNKNSWSVDVPFDHFGENTRPEAIKLAKNSGLIKKIFYKCTKAIPLRLWGRLGPYHVSQILPCYIISYSFAIKHTTMQCKLCILIEIIIYFVIAFGLSIITRTVGYRIKERYQNLCYYITLIYYDIICLHITH